MFHRRYIRGVINAWKAGVTGVKRHPTFEDNVIVYLGASILGVNTIIGTGVVIGCLSPNWFLVRQNIENPLEDSAGKKLFVTHGFGLPYYERRDKKSIELMTNRISRKVFTDDEKNYRQYPIFNVFGHDPHADAIITDHYAVIDTGCVYHKEAIPTLLTALEWPSKRLYQQNYID